jgi:hypothetical protein
MSFLTRKCAAVVSDSNVAGDLPILLGCHLFDPGPGDVLYHGLFLQYNG